MKKNLTDDVIVFFTKFSVMLSNGVPLVVSLSKLEAEVASNELKQAIAAIKEDVISGKTFADALQAFPDLFDESVIILLKAAQEAGSLDLISRVIPEHIMFGRLEDWKK